MLGHRVRGVDGGPGTCVLCRTHEFRRTSMDRIRRLELFVRAVDTGSFANAAASFELTPSGVSRAIAELEKQPAVALFHRTKRQQVLTEEGSEHDQRGRDILERRDEVEGELANEPSSP